MQKGFEMLQIGWKYFPFHEVPLNLPYCDSKLSGLRILQLSDLHLTPKVPVSYLHELVKKINQKNVDLVVFTGDILQTPAKKITQQLSVFGKIEAPSYYVSGNHDIVYGTKELQRILEKNNIQCLDNKIETINLKETTVQLVGLSDRYSFIKGVRRDSKKLFSLLEKDKFTLLLAHQPKDIKLTRDYSIDLQLSGHTHGGQVFPLNLIVKIFQPYFLGHYECESTQLYVTSGLGYWGVGIRYKVGSEIPIFTIK